MFKAITLHACCTRAFGKNRTWPVGLAWLSFCIHRCIRAALACKARHHYHSVQAVYVLATLALALDLNALVLMMLAKVKAVPKSKCWQAGLCLCKEQNMLSMMRGKLTQFLPASFAPEKAKYKSAIGVLLCPA